jgi:hypothetical protein
MKINWKRIVVAAICAEVLVCILYIPTVGYTMKHQESAATVSIVLAPLQMFIPLFLGGLWIARKIETHFVLHGALVGVFANVLYLSVVPTFLAPLLLGEQFNIQSQDVGWHVILAITLFAVMLRILGAVLGAYLGMKRRKMPLSA